MKYSYLVSFFFLTQVKIKMLTFSYKYYYSGSKEIESQFYLNKKVTKV
jgi:hypothetical protein